MEACVFVESGTHVFHRWLKAKACRDLCASVCYAGENIIPENPVVDFFTNSWTFCTIKMCIEVCERKQELPWSPNASSGHCSICRHNELKTILMRIFVFVVTGTESGHCEWNQYIFWWQNAPPALSNIWNPMCWFPHRNRSCISAKPPMDKLMYTNENKIMAAPTARVVFEILILLSVVYLQQCSNTSVRKTQNRLRNCFFFWVHVWVRV